MSDEGDDFSLSIVIPDEENIAHNLQRTCIELLSRSEFVDCTIACSDGQLQAHKIVLSSVSQYLHNLFTASPWPTPCSHPVIMLRNSNVSDVRSILEFIYTGKLTTSKNRIPALVTVIRELGVVSLEKAVKSAIQSCGIEMFRRLSNTNKNNSKQKDTQTTSSSKSEHLKRNYAKPSSCAAADDVLIEDEESLTQTMTAAVFIKSEPTDSFETNIYNTNISDDRSSNNNRKNDCNPIHLQLDKGESFVYTNDDLGMIVSMDQMENESDDHYLNNNDEDDIKDFSADEETINNNKTIPKTEKCEGDEPSTECVAVGNDSGDGQISNCCPWCMQVFTNLTLLQRHIKNHVGGNKPFACHYCNNTFARSAHLKRHLRVHTGEKPYACTVCGRAFARQDKLKVHLTRHVQNSCSSNNSNKSVNNSISIYPPPSMSQNAGGQVPIKILVPTGGMNLHHQQQQQQIRNVAIQQHQRKTNNATFANSTALNNLIASSEKNSGNSYISNNPGPATITPSSR